MANTYNGETPAPITTQHRVEILDFLRFLAIGLVVGVHYRYQLIPGGSVGVAVFFALSGYLITKNLLQKEVSIPEFLMRRMFRIYPSYLVVCLLNVAILYLTGSVKYNSFMQNLPGVVLLIKMPDAWLSVGLGIFWTLQIEMWFYFLIPFLIKKNNPLLRITIVLALIAVSFIFKSLVFFDIVKLSSYAIFRTLYWMDNLLYGTLTALLLENAGRQLSIKTMKFSPGLNINIVIISSLAMIGLIAFFTPSGDSVWPFRLSIVSGLTATVIFFSQKYQVSNYKMPRFVSYISLLAYSIYLLHPLLPDYYVACRHYFALPTAVYALMLISIIIVLILALHYLVEKPGIRMGHKLYMAYFHRPVQPVEKKAKPSYYPPMAPLRRVVVHQKSPNS